MIGYFLAVIICSLTYRLRGMGWPAGTQSGRLIWGSSVVLSAFLVGYDLKTAAMIGAGSALSMMISHSKVYQIFSFSDATVMFAIHATRANMAFFMASLTYWPFVFAFGFLGTAANSIGRWLQATNRSPDMLRVVEPITGAFFAACLIAMRLFNGH